MAPKRRPAQRERKSNSKQKFMMQASLARRLQSGPVIALSIFAAIAVMCAYVTGRNVAANIVAALMGIGALVTLTAASDRRKAEAERASAATVSIPQSDSEPVVHLDRENRGVVKRFSQRHGWGLITCAVSQDLSNSRSKGEPRNDVRFYGRDMEALSLNIGDAVRFRAILDDAAPGWLRATDIQHDDGSGAQEQTKKEHSSANALETEPCLPVVEEENCSSAEPLPQAADKQSACSAAPAPRLETGVADEPAADEDPVRPPTTPVVARRMLLSHLEVPLSPEQRAEEKAFWKRSPKEKSPEYQ